MSGGSVGAQDIPVNEVDEYDSLEFASANDEQRVFDVDSQTQAIVIAAHPNNSGVVFIGFDDDVTVNNGLPLSAGGHIILPVDASTVGVFAVADTLGDELRYAAMG